jgi:tRNA G37 N-methylase Trm5
MILHVTRSPDKGSLPYVPTLSKEHVKLVRRWYERAYSEGRAEGRGEQSFEYLGTTIVVPTDVMPVTPMSHLLGEAGLAEIKAGERVLDKGTRSDVNAILAATKGARVLAVDINPHALGAARANAERTGVADLVEAKYSVVFSEVKGTFDLVVFDPPFRWFRPRDLPIEKVTVVLSSGELSDGRSRTRCRSSLRSCDVLGTAAVLASAVPSGQAVDKGEACTQQEGPSPGTAPRRRPARWPLWR